jgi:hypothetical protein
MDQFSSYIKERFELLACLRVAAKDSPSDSDPLPLYLGILLAAMDSENKAPCCFILPRRGKTAHLSAIIFGLTQFIGDYTRIDRHIAETNFTPGQNVFVRPPNKVYRYLGIYKDNPAWIQLGIIGKTDWETFPLSDIRRLEETQATQPAGKLAQIPRDVRETPFDRLMQVNTGGNFSAFLNHVFLLDFKSEFEDVVNSIHLQKLPHIPDMPLLGDLLPLGSISQPDETGNVKMNKWNFQNFMCDPLVAVTSSHEKMVAACKSMTPYSKVVLVNGLGLLASHLLAYDEIVRTQRLVIVAEHGEQEQMQPLADRGCKFWWLGQREILMGAGIDPARDTTAKVFGAVFAAARNEAKMEIESEICDNQLLNDIAVQLVSLDEAVKADSTGTTKGIVSRTYKLLNEAASLVQMSTRDESRRFTDQLIVIRRELERDKHWIGDPAVTLAAICRSFDTALSDTGRLGESKGELLLKVLRNMYEKSGQQTAILARNNSQVKQLQEWSHRFGFDVRIFTPSTVPEDGSFGCIVCVAWPGGDAFQRVARRFLAPRIKVIGYAFENNWLKQCHRKLRQRPRFPNFTQAEQSDLMKNGKTGRIVWPDEPEKTENEIMPPATTFSIWAFENRLRSVRKGGTASVITTEDTVAAKYVGFRGASYAYITEGHKLPIVTDLLATTEGTRQKTPMKEIEGVMVGDFAVFRDGGSRDVIQVIADKLLQRNGQDAATLRKRANLWVEALRSTRMKADQILARMSALGPGKTLITIRNWLSNDSMIGPGLRTDLDLIAKLTQSKELEKTEEEVWAAIKQIRGAHLSAGTWLTSVLLQKLPSCLGEIEEGGTNINIEDVVTAWVVQVEDISPQFEQFPRSSVNRLLWERFEGATDLLL